MGDDGMLDVFIIDAGDGFSRAKLLSLFEAGKKGFASVQEMDGLLMYRCRAYEVHPEEGTDPVVMGPDTINIDGKLTGSPPYRVAAVPRSLRYICGGEKTLVDQTRPMCCNAYTSQYSVERVNIDP